MPNVIKALLLKLPLPGSRLERAVATMLKALPRCSQSVVIAGPAYGDAHYHGDVIAATTKLLRWVEAEAGESWHSSLYEEAARKALPMWLRNADLTEPSPTLLNNSLIEVLKPTTAHFIKIGVASVYCMVCSALYSDIRMNRVNERSAGPYSYWTDDWRCPHDHILYSKDHEVHFLRNDDVAIAKTATERLVTVNVLDPSGNYSTKWEVGKDISRDIFDKAKDQATGELFAITTYAEGRPTTHVCKKERWLGFKDQFDRIDREGAAAMEATRKNYPELFNDS